jgi:excisionase family DNA binding protein
MPSAMMSVKGAAEYLGLGRSAIYELVAAKKLACYRMGPKGGRLKFKAADLDAYTERQREGPKTKEPAKPLYVAKHF